MIVLDGARERVALLRFQHTLRIKKNTKIILERHQDMVSFYRGDEGVCCLHNDLLRHKSLMLSWQVSFGY